MEHAEKFVRTLPPELIDRIVKELSRWDDVAAGDFGEHGLEPSGPHSMSVIVRRKLTEPRPVTREMLKNLGILGRDESE